MNEILSGAGVRRTEAWEYESAINERTAGIIYVATENSEPPIESIISIAKKNKVGIWKGKFQEPYLFRKQQKN